MQTYDYPITDGPALWEEAVLFDLKFDSEPTDYEDDENVDD